MFVALFGPNREAASLAIRDWDRFIHGRRHAAIGPDPTRRRPVGPRQVEHDLLFLRAVLNWAVTARLPEANPLRGLKVPREQNPHRPIVDHATYEALLRVAYDVDWRFRLALVLTHETGHRQGAIRHLRWSDIDLDTGRIEWRAEHDKIGRAHWTPLTDEAMAALRRAQHMHPAVGERWVVPSPRDPMSPVDRTCLSK